MLRSRLFFALCTLVGMSAPALAVDGVTLIDQSTVMASGGFPFHITSSGSYRLAGNLLAPGTTAIVISAANVTLDLNGFTVACYTCSSVPGIVAVAIRTAILNGNITGFNGLGPAYGIQLTVGDGPFDYQARIDHVNADSNNVGIWANAAVKLSVSNSSASFNSYAGISAAPGPGSLTVTNCSVTDNGSYGIQMGNGVVTGSAIVRNGLASTMFSRGGIAVNGTSTVTAAATITNNTISGNQQFGLLSTSGPIAIVGYGSNTFGGNSNSDVSGISNGSMKNNIYSGGVF